METKHKSTYLDTLQKSLDTDKELLKCLIQRKHLEKHHPSNNPNLEFERNEHKIFLIDNEARIVTLAKVIKEKEVYFKKFAEQFDKDVEEVNLKYDSTLQKAKEVQHKNNAVNWLMTNAKFENINSDAEGAIEAKVGFYKKLKEALK
jgi:hypothetical protein